ncbi:hypothetical protein D3C72_2074540 [compost metagenome]
MLLYRTGVDAVAQFHGQGEYVDVFGQARQLEMVVEHLMHQVAQLEVVLAVGLDDFGQAVLGQDQLASGGVLAVDGEHALLHQP